MSRTPLGRLLETDLEDTSMALVELEDEFDQRTNEANMNLDLE